MQWQKVGLVALGLLVASSPAMAQGRGHEQGRGQGKPAHAQRKAAFRSNDHVIIRNYYTTHRIVVTPLRPAVARLVVVGRPVPAQVVLAAPPPDLVVLLAPLPDGYSYYLAGDRMLILDRRRYVVGVTVGF